jgi:drug/metabolite transporter (DMT)-like permease
MILLPFLMRYGLLAMQTQRPMGHLIRGLLLVTANVCFYTGLASLPLAEASAIVFLAPVFVTFLSWSFLDEKFGSSRWVAVSVGLVGMLFVMKPFSETIEVAFLWPLAAAFCYAGFTVATRYLGRTESAPLLAVTAQTSFVLVSGLVGITAGGGQFAGHADLGLEFLLRAWRWPETADVFYLFGIGILSSITALSLSYAYRNAEASFLAPFEYTILPFVLLWGYLLFDEFPDGFSLFGILLIAAGGLIIWLDGSRSRKTLNP